MTQQEFITKIACYVQKYAPKYNIAVCSPIIAQAILESAYGTSELAVYAHNYFGLKWRENRCPTACGVYHKIGSEQNADGTYTSSAMKWMKFADMENGVIGYFDFINNANYSNLKGVTDPKKYLENIKADGYATSLKYVDNVYSVIEKWNLTMYDFAETEKKVIALDAGHGYNTAGKRCSKSLDPDQTREWWLNDRIMDLVEAKLFGYECTVLRVGDTTGQKDISLSARAKAANDAKAVVYVSMHHNAGLYGRKGGGTVVFYYSKDIARPSQTMRLYKNIVNKTGLVGNRSQKIVKKEYTVLKKTNMPAFLVENGFMDGPDDVPVILSQEHALKTAEGVVAFLVEEFCLEPKKSSEKPLTQPQTYPAYTGSKTTLSVALKSLEIDYSYAFRKKIAAANGISGYRGTAAQNTQMYNLLVAGLLKKA